MLGQGLGRKQGSESGAAAGDGRRRVNAYHVVGAGLVLWSAGVAVQHTWATDFLLHVATVDTLARDLFTPPDPMTGTGAGSPYHSPLTWLLAVVVRVTGLSSTAVFGVLAVLNTTLLVWAFHRFCRWFTGSPLGPRSRCSPRSSSGGSALRCGAGSCRCARWPRWWRTRAPPRSA
ncbi:hypothetical protein O7606_22485 [Micromonospora sp. WMMD882]|uniref:hypothetical protein n=1 Tax=Micromonospora sp. WMMD882 TaxID=3015151 RepID=UPI00248B5691|nr:hypothetical protein [Micromonospora sp. WMMD882]WBB78934.1 hypothetical protein O7606_22485 [Micromonospora sp. WMMD882]